MNGRLLLVALLCLLAATARVQALQPEPETVEGEIISEGEVGGSEGKNVDDSRSNGKAPPIIYDGSGDPSGDAPEDGEILGPPQGFDDGCMSDCCGDDCCDTCCGDCYSGCCGGGFWGRAEALGWWVRGGTVPPLVTTSPVGTPQQAAGVLPAAEVLFPTERVNGEGRMGGRFTLGYWDNDCETAGFEGNFLVLEDQGDAFSASSDGSSIIARPFFNVNTGLPDAVLVSFPGVVAGTINVETENSVLGAEANWRRTAFRDCRRKLDVIAGYRFFRFDESLRTDESAVSIDPIGNIPLGTTLEISDIVGCESEFHGGQLGMIMRHQGPCWSFDVLAKCALGSMNQRVSINGSTAINVPGAPGFASQGGFLALNSNIGEFENSRFSAIPELGLTLSRQISCLWRFSVGYTFIYVPNVVRPGDQVNLNINPNLFPPATGGGMQQPSFTFNDRDLWLQGINLGLECRF